MQDSGINQRRYVMSIGSIKQAVRATVLAHCLLLPIVVWGGDNVSLSSPLGINDKHTGSLDLSWATEMIMNKNALGGPLLLTAEPMSLAAPDNADWDGLKKDTALFLGYQLSIIGLLYVMPASISGWTDETKSDFSIQQYKDNANQVVWDKDDWWINYILHPYWGGVYYVRAQQRGFGPVGSFWYSVALSSLYEFGAEAFFEKPSIQDLIVTPGAGYFVGKYFMDVRARIHKKQGKLSGRDKFVLVMTDPMGAMNNKVDSLFGGKDQVSLRLMLGPQLRTSDASEARFEGSHRLRYIGTSDFGLKMTLQW